jgi:hypothetical protein
VNACVVARLLAVLALAVAGAAYAHDTSTSYLHVESTENAAPVRIRWDLAVSDLQWQLDLDADGDSRIVWSEVEAAREALVRLAASSVEIARGGEPCRLAPGDLALARHGDGIFASLAFEAACARAGLLGVSTNLFFGNAAHRTLLDVATSQRRLSSVLSPSSPRWLEPAAPTVAATLARFLKEGVIHVLIGYDHIAFLLLLLLPSVLRGARAGWQPAANGREVARDLVKIVTAFTVAHSVTLGLAATGTVNMPVQPIEIAIAASIVIAGLMNLFPAASQWRLSLAFGFGLMHGFGFANALGEIGAEGFGLAPMLAGFNLGVEVAQLAIVAVTLPLLLWMRRSPLYAMRLMPALSLATAMTGATWLVDRLG